jgi:hypothetical protein
MEPDQGIEDAATTAVEAEDVAIVSEDVRSITNRQRTTSATTHQI